MEMLTLQQAARTIGESPSITRDRVLRGELPAYQMPTPGGFRYKIAVSDLSNFLNRCRVQAGA